MFNLEIRKSCNQLLQASSPEMSKSCNQLLQTSSQSHTKQDERAVATKSYTTGVTGPSDTASRTEWAMQHASGFPNGVGEASMQVQRLSIYL